MSRRDIIRWAAMGGSGAALLAACRTAVDEAGVTGSSPATMPPSGVSVPPTSAAPATTQAVDPSRP
ncbi:MAG: hypothetical protein ACKO27_08580, partial [Ilumatobacteraceae bacterium]